MQADAAGAAQETGGRQVRPFYQLVFQTFSTKQNYSSDEVLTDILDMDPSIASDPDFVDFVSGNKILEGSIPMAHRYGGHQFGLWVSQDFISQKRIQSA